jgi:hypothetical protein
MTERVLGPTGSPRRRWTLLLPLVVMIALGLFYITGAQAVHETGAFELDGNATSADALAPLGPADDWDRVCHEVTITNDTTNSIPDECSSASDTTDSDAVSWVAEPALNSTIFTGGGSKDPQDTNQWAWKDEAGGLPDKDNLLHGFAVKYTRDATPAAGTCPNGTGGPLPQPPVFDPSIPCVLIYFGSDRYDNSGDAQQGFWFTQNPIGLGSNSVGGGTGFTGVHKNGDVLVISDFSNGGGTSTITVYKWDSTCTKGATKPNPGDCGDVNLRLLSTSDDAKCTSTLQANDNACGIVNPGLITMPWSFTDKSGTAANGALNGEFYEAGINLSTLGLAGECFSSVVSETRSSTSTTATLKDFVLGQFAVCAPNLDTASSSQTSVARGTAVYDTAKVTITGAISPADATGTVAFSLCGPAASKALADCSTGGTAVGASAVALSNADCVPAYPASSSTTDGISCAKSLTVNETGQTGIRGPLTVGFYCWGAVADLTNYADPARFHNATTECFEVTDTSSGNTAQNWRPNDSATFSSTGGSALAGTVEFTLYNNLTCTAGTNNVNVLYTETRNIVTDGTGTASSRTVNTTNDGSAATDYLASADANVSWRAVFTSTNSVTGSQSGCETSALDITN